MTGIFGGGPVRVRIGILRLADSAPALVAEANGLFAALGLDAEILVEPSWANVLDKLTWGLLDAAIMLPPLALAATLGLRGAQARLMVPMGLTSGGNSVVIDPRARVGADGAPAAIAARLLAWMRVQPSPPRIGVVHIFSSHNLLLRAWLSEAGGRPDVDWETIVLPPELAVDALAAGQVAGFSAGAPWGEVAASRGVGQTLVGSSMLSPGHPEKCLCVAASWAEAQPHALTALARAMLRAGAICNDPAQGDAVAGLLAAIGLSRASCRAALPGGTAKERIQFAEIAGPAPSPQIWRADPRVALRFFDEMQAAGLIDPHIDGASASTLYRPDLLLPALEAEGFTGEPKTPSI